MKLKHYALSSGAILALGTLALAPSAYADDDLPVGAAPHEGDELIIDVDNETTTWVNEDLEVNTPPAAPPASNDGAGDSSAYDGAGDSGAYDGAGDSGAYDGAGDSGAYDIPAGPATPAAPADPADPAGPSAPAAPAPGSPDVTAPAPSTPTETAPAPAGPTNDAPAASGNAAPQNGAGSGTATPDADGHSVGIDDVDAAPGHENHEVVADNGTPGGEVLENYVPSDHPCTTADCDPSHFVPTEEHSVEPDLEATPSTPPAKDDKDEDSEGNKDDNTPDDKDNTPSTSGGTPNDNAGTQPPASGTDTPSTGGETSDEGDKTDTQDNTDKVISRHGESVTISLEIFDPSTLATQEPPTDDSDKGEQGSGSDDQGTDEQGTGKDESGSDEQGTDEQGSDEQGSDEQGSGSDESGQDSTDPKKDSQTEITTAVGASVVFEGEVFDISKLKTGDPSSAGKGKSTQPQTMPEQPSGVSTQSALAETGSQASGTLSLAGLLAGAGAAFAALRRRR